VTWQQFFDLRTPWFSAGPVKEESFMDDAQWKQLKTDSVDVGNAVGKIN